MFSHENAYLIFLGRLAQHDINRNDPIWVKLPKAAKAKASAVLFHKNASFICLGQLGQHDTSRKKPICVPLPMSTKASKIKSCLPKSTELERCFTRALPTVACTINK